MPSVANLHLGHARAWRADLALAQTPDFNAVALLREQGNLGAGQRTAALVSEVVDDNIAVVRAAEIGTGPAKMTVWPTQRSLARLICGYGTVVIPAHRAKTAEV